MGVLVLLKRFGPLVLLIALGWYAAHVWQDRRHWRQEAKALRELVETYRENEATVDQLREEVQVCLDKVRTATTAGEEWQRLYEEARSEPPEVIRVPVEVAAPGTPADEAIAQAAAWFRDHPR